MQSNRILTSLSAAPLLIADHSKDDLIWKASYDGCGYNHWFKYKSLACIGVVAKKEERQFSLDKNNISCTKIFLPARWDVFSGNYSPKMWGKDVRYFNIAVTNTPALPHFQFL